MIRKVRTIVEMSDRPTIRPATLLGLALGGVLLGHAVTYRLLLPDAHARATELARTGHGYLTGANTLGLLAVVAAMAAVFLGRLLRGETPTASVVAWRLATFQVASFAALEVLERLGSASGFDRMVPLLLIGVPAQLLVAGLVVLLVRFAIRTAAVVADLAVHGTAAWPHPPQVAARPAMDPWCPARAATAVVPPGRAPPVLRPC